MIRDDAERLCVRLRERFGGEPPSGLSAEVKASDSRVEFAPPGGARPHIIRYQILLAAGEREAVLGLDDVESLLDAAGPDWDVERLFAEITRRAEEG